MIDEHSCAISQIIADAFAIPAEAIGTSAPPSTAGALTVAGLERLNHELKGLDRAVEGAEQSVIGLYRVIESNFLPLSRVQWRFPRSKRKRIRRKWAKDPRNWRDGEPIAFVMTYPTLFGLGTEKVLLTPPV